MKVILFLLLSYHCVAQASQNKNIPYKPAKSAPMIVYFQVWRGGVDTKYPLAFVQKTWFDTLAVHTKRTVLNDIQQWIDTERKKLPPIQSEK
jgi:hypothetical protein